MRQHRQGGKKTEVKGEKIDNPYFLAIAPEARQARHMDKIKNPLKSGIINNMVNTKQE
ncbi:MAG: hypothetical protein WC862_03980 [Patescibacteria group bacterium]